MLLHYFTFRMVQQSYKHYFDEVKVKVAENCLAQIILVVTVLSEDKTSCVKEHRCCPCNRSHFKVNVTLTQLGLVAH